MQRVDGRVQTIEGSTLWNDEDEIVNILGSVSVDTTSGKVIINNGYGLYTNDGGTQYGYFNENNLDAGVIVNIINGDTTQTTIKADMINLEGYVTASYVDATILDVESLKSASGLTGSIAVTSSVTAGSVIADTYYFKDPIGTANEELHTRPVQLLESGYLSNISAVAIGTAQTLNLTHYHDIDIEEVTTGANAGKMKVTIGHAVATSDTSNHIDYFKIADTTAYKNGVASAQNSIELYDYTWNISSSDSETAAHGKIYSVTFQNARLGYQSGTQDDQPVYTQTKLYESIGPEYITDVYNAGWEAGSQEGSGGYEAGYADGQTNADAVIHSISIENGTADYSSNTLWFDIFANPDLVLTDKDGVQQPPVTKTGMTDTFGLPVTVTDVTISDSSIVYNHNGTYTIGGSGGNVNIGAVNGVGGANIPVDTNAHPFTPTEALNDVNVVKGNWTGTAEKSITFTTSAPSPNANAPKTLTLATSQGNWTWTTVNDASFYQKEVQVKDKAITTAIMTEPVDLPDISVYVSGPGQQQDSWWQTTGTNANKYVVPASTANAYLTSDSSKQHSIGSGTGSEGIVVDPSEAIDHGKTLVYPSIEIAGWFWDQSGAKALRNVVASYNPDNTDHYNIQPLDLPTLSVGVTKTGTTVYGTGYADYMQEGTSVTDTVLTSVHNISVSSVDAIPDGTTAEELSGDKFVLKYTKDGTDTAWAYYTIDGSEQAETTLTGEWNGRNYTVTASPQGDTKTGTVYDGLVFSGSVTKSGKSVSRNYIVYSDDGEGNADEVIMEKTVTIPADQVYDDGWDDASGVVDVPKTASTAETVSIDTPYSRTVSGGTTRGTDTNTYTLMNLGNNSVILNWDQGNSGNGITVAKLDHNKYNAGWLAAAGICSPPIAYTGEAESADFTVGIPSSTVGSGTTYSFSIGQETPSATNKWAYVNYDDNGTSRLVGKINVSGWYTAGQGSVSAILSSTTVPSGTTPNPLPVGDYGVYLIKDNVQDSTPVSYYKVSSGGNVTYVTSSNGNPVNVYSGTLTVYGRLYPNTDVVLGSGTDQLGRRQISYRGRSGYVSASALSATKGSTNYPTRIGWVDEGDAMASRSVTQLSKVILASTDTGETSHTVDVTYDDGNTETGGATVVVDASAIAGGGGSTVRTAESLRDTIVLPASHTGTAVIYGNYVEYDDESESGNFPVVINASAVYQQGRTDGSGQVVNGTITSVEKYLVDGYEQSYDDSTHKYTVHVKASGTNISNSPYTQDIVVLATRAYNQGKTEGGASNVTISSITGTDLGNPSSEANPGTIVATASNGKTGSEYLYLTQGNWNSSNKKAVNIRVGSTSGPLIARTWVDAITPNVSTERNASTTGITTTNIRVGNNIKVIVKLGSKTVHEQIFIATT